MIYHSLFDTIVGEDPTFRVGFDRQKYQGTLDEVLSETEGILCSGGSTDTVKLALHPPRIIRAFVDYKIQHPSRAEVELLLRDATQLGLDVYRGDDNAVEEIRELRRRTQTSGNEEVLKRALKQPSDSVTWNATHPSRSKKTAGDLAMKTSGGDVLFVALAHGGVAAGMDAYLRYCDEVGSEGSEFYVARFSTQKLGDLTPRLSSTEIAHLQEQATGRQPVIFDEDRASGKTLNGAQQFFGGTVFPFGNLVILTNLDARVELMSLGFGKKVLELDKYKLGDKDKHEYISNLYDNLDNYLDKKYNGDLKIFYLSLSSIFGDEKLCGAKVKKGLF